MGEGRAELRQVMEKIRESYPDLPFAIKEFRLEWLELNACDGVAAVCYTDGCGGEVSRSFESVSKEAAEELAILGEVLAQDKTWSVVLEATGWLVFRDKYKVKGD